MPTNVFTLDGKAYNVRVLSLKRKFSVLDTDQSGRVQTGEMYRDIIGTYYNYEMTVQAHNRDPDALDALWDAVSQPTTAHDCTFPYNQRTLSQRMYITGGEQDLFSVSEGGNRWDTLKLSFIAERPAIV